MVPYRELFGKKCNCTSGVAMISACGCRSCKLYRVYKVAVCCLLTNEPCSGGKSTVGCLTWNQRTILFLSKKKRTISGLFFSFPLSRHNALCGEQLRFSHGGADGWMGGCVRATIMHFCTPKYSSRFMFYVWAQDVTWYLNNACVFALVVNLVLTSHWVALTTKKKSYSGETPSTGRQQAEPCKVPARGACCIGR